MADHGEGGKNRIPEIEKEILGIHSREIQATTVAQDLPRFASRITVVDYCGLNPQVLFRGSELKEKLDEREVLNELLKTIATHKKMKPSSGVDKFLKSLDKHLGANLPSGVDLGKTFKEFIENEAALHTPSMFVNVLKCLNQEIPFPIVKMLRDTIHKEAQFKDKRGSWLLRIEIFSKKIVVKHIKSNQARSTEPSENYEFTWELALILSNKHPLEYSFNLLEVIIGKHASDDTRNLITKLFNQYKTPTFDALSMWKRSTTDGEVLAASTCIFCSDFRLTKNSKTVFEVAGGKISVESALNMCHHLAVALGEGDVAKALLSFQKAEYDEELSVKDTLTQFFSSQPIPEESRTIQVLKAIHPDLGIGAVMELRQKVGPHLKYKGCRNTWQAEVEIVEDKCIVVSVSKKEQSECNEEGSFFQFEWENSCEFDQYMWAMKAVRWRISDLRFHRKTSKSVQDLAQKVLSPYISVTKPFNHAKGKEEDDEQDGAPVPQNVSSIPLQTAIQALTRTLRTVEGQLPEVRLEGERPVSVISLLESMYHSSTRSDHPLPVVYLSRREKWAIGRRGGEGK